MMFLMTFFWAGEYGFSTVEVGVIPGNECGIQRQNYVALLQYYSRGVKRQQGFTTVVGQCLYNVIGYRFVTWYGPFSFILSFVHNH